MNRLIFEQLRELPDKEITDDIIFKKENMNTLSFDNVKVLNSMGIDLLLNGKYKPDIPSIRFNFYVRGIGPVCRVEVNSSVHGESGRTHKHTLHKENCPRRNLPYTEPRADLENRNAEEVWRIVCKQANINHSGNFVKPDG
ncbi:MAG: hypothetical protein BWK80_09940 [Desulfobacteraceae bacterium IS3]|nr:MAG: hypothetical protein BWK80_09940 [Desulfobacteraceae bacterium IS3]